LHIRIILAGKPGPFFEADKDRDGIITSLLLPPTNPGRYLMPQAHESLLQLLCKGRQLDDLLVNEHGQRHEWTRNIRSSSESLSFLLRQTWPDYQCRSLEERIRFAIDLSRPFAKSDLASAVKIALAGRQIDYKVCSTRDLDKFFLLHGAACNLGELYVRESEIFDRYVRGHEQNDLSSFLVESQNKNSKLSQISELLNQLISRGSRIYSRTGAIAGLTPPFPDYRVFSLNSNAILGRFYEE
jgi:hypothetical protein